MSIVYLTMRKSVLACSALVAVSQLTLPAVFLGQDQTQKCNATAPDNSGKNKTHRKTADQQPENTSDREVTAKIRRSLIADKSLSTYGHNVKIITQGGAVTLKGPVHSEEEKQTIASKAEAVAGKEKVTNQLTVKQ